MKQETIPMREGYDLGMGVAMASASPMALGVTGAISTAVGDRGESGTFIFNRIERTEDLENTLGIGVEASGGIGLFSASASFSFSKECKIQSSSLCVCVSSTLSLPFQQIDVPVLSEPAQKLMESGKTDLFSSRFGDYFVRGVKSGGYFVGLVRIDTKDETSKTAVDAALSMSYGLAFDANVQISMKNTMKNSEAKVTALYTYEGGIVTTRVTSKDAVEALDQLFKAMGEWTATIRDHPKAYSVTVAPYIIALGPEPPNIAELEHRRDVLIRCAKLRARTLDALNLVDYILDPHHADEFEIAPPPKGPDLPALQVALAGDIDAIADAAAYAINNAKEAREVEAYMKEIKGIVNFKLTVLPNNMPHHGRALQPPTSETSIIPESNREKQLLIGMHSEGVTNWGKSRLP